MNLAEEYYLRHSLGPALGHHTYTQGSLILRSDLGWRWAIVHCQWKPQNNHPGYYQVKVLVPSYNTSGRGNGGLESARGFPPQLTVTYEQYEDFLVLLAKTFPTEGAVMGREERILASWEMYLYNSDSFLANHCNDGIRNAIARTMEGDLSRRFAAYNEAVAILMKEQQSAFEYYERTFHTHTRKPLTWLGDAINLRLQEKS